MKKISLTSALVLVLVFALSIAGCKKDNNDNQTNGDLLGVWTCTTLNYDGTSVSESGGISFTTDFVGEGYDIDFTLTVSENPNIIAAEGNYSIKLTSSVGGVTINTQNIEGLEFANTGEWTRDGNTITILNELEELSDATIVKLTDTELELKISDVRSFTVPEGTATSTTNTTITFVR